ncbi:MAG: UDP-N-acetylmuramate dehydrogenase [Spirochaetaceae bacterium]
MSTVHQYFQDINIAGTVLFDEPMSRHTTFQVGGPADVFVTPRNEDDIPPVLSIASTVGAPLFVLGGGANILVADAGIRGVVLDISALNELGREGTLLHCGAGAEVTAVTSYAADAGLGGIDFLHSMPGSIGGAIWMNARCYGSSIVDILREVRGVTSEGARFVYRPRQDDWEYKRSPFQSRKDVITSCDFALFREEPSEVWDRMLGYYRDREQKGHFSAPSAGSVFKNNRAFGKPSGAIIDSLGLRGKQIGGAKISDRHANIIVNTGHATAREIRDLMEEVRQKVREELGFELEQEVLYVGEWV